MGGIQHRLPMVGALAFDTLSNQAAKFWDVVTAAGRRVETWVVQQRAEVDDPAEIAELAFVIRRDHQGAVGGLEGAGRGALAPGLIAGGRWYPAGIEMVGHQ